jgi:hypothetical protein
MNSRKLEADMPVTIDALLDELRTRGTENPPAGLEDAVWGRVAARRAAKADFALTLRVQVAVALVALSVGAVFQHAYLGAHGVPAPVYSETIVLSDYSLMPSMKL